jgi:hypothetical protein
MNGRTVLGVLGVVLAFAVAAVLALLAADVARTEQALERGDTTFARAAGARGMWSADTVLPAGAGRALLDVDDDVDYRTAVQRFRLSRPREPVTRFAQLAERSGAEAALARTARRDPDRIRQSALFNLRGALALEESRLGAGSGPSVRRAVGHFRRAVELDATNEDARFNLELALRLLSRSGGSSAGSGERAATPASGAGAASTGSGY